MTPNWNFEKSHVDQLETSHLVKLDNFTHLDSPEIARRFPYHSLPLRNASMELLVCHIFGAEILSQKRECFPLCLTGLNTFEGNETKIHFGINWWWLVHGPHVTYSKGDSKFSCVDVSENGGTPKSSILIGFSIINHPFWGYPYFWKHPCIQTLFLDAIIHCRDAAGIGCLDSQKSWLSQHTSDQIGR